MSESVSSDESSIIYAYSHHPHFGEELLQILEQNDDPSLKTLEITGGETLSYLDFDWEKRGGAFANNRHLRHLYIELDHRGDAARDHNIKAFYRALASNRSITNLSIHNSLIDDDARNMFEELLTPFFYENDTIRSFSFIFGGDGSMDSTISPSLISVLASNKKTLRCISVVSGGMGHMARVIDEIATHENMKELTLNFCDNDDINEEKEWCTAVGNLLQYPLSKLKNLNLEDTPTIRDEGLIIIGRALSSNTTLKRINGLDQAHATPTGWDALANALCDNTSIESIYNSNHTLQEINFTKRPNALDVSDDEIVQEIRQHAAIRSKFDPYLELNNSGDNKTEVARRKIIQYYFDNGNSNIQEIVEMEVNELPYAISWSSRKEAGLSLLYHLLRSMPSLFEINLPVSIRG